MAGRVRPYARSSGRGEGLGHSCRAKGKGRALTEVVVVDASAGVELVVDTERGKALRRLIPPQAVLAVPEHFFVEVTGVLRRWENRGVVTASQAAEALDRLVHWPLRRSAIAELVVTGWTYRQNLTISDGIYVTLAERLGAALLTDDHRLVNAPTFPPQVRRLTVS